MSDQEPVAIPESPTGSVPPKDWRSGKKSATTAAGIGPAWRSTPAELPAHLVSRRRFRRGLITGLLFLMAVFLFGFLVRGLLFYPHLTPFVALAAVHYDYPLPPNSWAREDLDRLLASDTGLQQKTLSIRDLSMSMRSLEAARVALANALKSSREEAIHSGTLMVFVSAHGMINDDGQVSLLLPDANPTDSKTWWPLQDVFQQIASLNLPDSVLKLVILDCNRELVNWRLGMVTNQLVNHLESEIRQAKLPNLAIYNSCSAGELGWQSRDLHGSIFTQFLHMGLAGAADTQGNHNRRITLHELCNYVTKSVDSWAWTNRHARQRPRLIPADQPDHPLLWSVGSAPLAAILSEADTRATPVTTIPVESLTRLWFDFASLREQKLLRNAPGQLAQFEHRLLWLEQASVAGEEYTEAALNLQRDLEEDLKQWQDLPDVAIAAFNNVMPVGLKNSTLFPNSVPLDSIPLATRFGVLTDTEAEMVRGELNQIASAPSLQNINSAIKRAEADPRIPRLAEIHFLKLLAQYLPTLESNQASSVADLLRLQIQAERVAVPPDEQQLHWLLPLLTASDIERRNALDAFFSSQPALTALAAASLRLTAAENLSSQLSAVIQLRDRVQAELPYLASWVSRTSWPQEQLAIQDRLVKETLPQLTDGLRSLNLLLGQPPAKDDFQTLIDASPFQAEMDDISKSYDALRDLVDAEYARLLKEPGNSAEALAATINLMKLPLLPRRESSTGLAPFAQRSALYQSAMRLSTQLNGRYPPFKPITQAEKPPAESTVTRLACRWPDSPALLVLGLRDLQANAVTLTSPPQKFQTDSARPLEVGRRIRAILRAVPEGLDHFERQVLTSRTNPRPTLVASDHLLRITAPLLSLQPQQDPTRDLRMGDLQFQILQDAERRLGDFWGLASGPHPQFFEHAAQQDLTIAKMLVAPHAYIQEELARLRRMLESQGVAARQGLLVTANDILFLESLPEIPTSVQVQSNPNLAPQAFPPGLATTLLRPNGTALALARKNLQLPLTDPKTPNQQTLEFQLSPQVLSETQLRWDSILSYRGHEYRGGFLAHLPQGSVTDFSPVPLGPATILVSGGPVKNESVVFILDCSHSMSEKAPKEGPTEPGTRLEEASMALSTMLEKLAERKDIRVGVQFFGHRVGWNTKQVGQLLPQVNYGRPIPAGLKPFEDVEVILPVGRFDPSWRASVEKLLKTVQPWGESPIYLALTQAMNLFDPQIQDETRTIILVTDGVNYQFNPSFTANKQLPDVLAAMNGRPAAVHIVGFGIHDRDAETAQREFGSLAASTGGSFVSVDRATELVESLEKILTLREYKLAPSRSPVQTARVGETLTVPGIFPPTEMATVSLGGATQSVQFSGNEALELQATIDGRNLLSARYLRNLTQFVPLLGPTSLPSRELGIHRAIRRNEGVLFEFSLQDAQQKFVALPEGFWLTISPGQTVAGTQQQPYIFYDAEYVTKMPVPVVRWLATNWPEAHSTAKVEAWICQELPTPLQKIPLGKSVDTAIRDGLPVVVPSLPDVQVDLRIRSGQEDRIDVIVRHQSALTNEDVLHVKLATDRSIQRVVRRFDFEQRVAVHMFLLANDPRTLQERFQGTSIELRTHRSFADGAMHLGSPVLVNIATDQGLIQLTPMPKMSP